MKPEQRETTFSIAETNEDKAHPDPRFEQAVEKVIAAAKKNGIGSGLMVASAASARKWHDKGASMISLAAEARILSVAATQAVKEIKAGR